MNRHQYQDFAIEIFNDPSHTIGSVDNITTYSKYFGDGGKQYPSSKHGIRIYIEDQEISNCLIIGSGGATGIYDNSSIKDDDSLLICCSDTIFCLSIPDLDLIWQTKADQVTCFQIFKLLEDYLIYGETEISRLDKYGRIIWQYSGSDIFVSVDGDETFKMNTDHIALIDFSKNRVKLGFDGKVL